MSQGRCSARVGTLMLVVISLSVLVLMDSQVADAALYMIGGQNGWSFNMGSWTKGKNFIPGDTLVFKYSPGLHNVVPVDRNGFSSCNAPPGSRVFQSGRDQISVKRGGNFFICTFPGHCASGMRIAIFA